MQSRGAWTARSRTTRAGSTPIDYAFNPFRTVTAGATHPTVDLSVTDEVMARCADLLSSSRRSCILSNHALDQNSGIASRVRAAQVYAEINALYEQHRGRTPVDFQTYGPISLYWCQAIAVAVAHHAQSVELWPPSARAPGYGAFPESVLAAWARALRQRRAPSC